MRGIPACPVLVDAASVGQATVRDAVGIGDGGGGPRFFTASLRRASGATAYHPHLHAMAAREAAAETYKGANCGGPRSLRRGFSTKTHAAVDALGNPVRLVVTEGQEADVTQSEPMIRAHRADNYMGDKEYDSDKVVKAAQRRGAKAIIPSRKNRKVARKYDKHLYKERVKVEWFSVY